MADLTRQPGPGGDPMQRNPEDNRAQSQSDATADEVGVVWIRISPSGPGVIVPSS